MTTHHAVRYTADTLAPTESASDYAARLVAEHTGDTTHYSPVTTLTAEHIARVSALAAARDAAAMRDALARRGMLARVARRLRGGR